MSDRIKDKDESSIDARGAGEGPAAGARAALVYDIQRFCLHDGPGVRTTFFFKGCPLRCPWCSNPESIDSRPDLYHIRTKCIHCGECARVCPEGCIAVEDDKFLLDRKCCRRCFACVAACPTAALVQKGQWFTPGELLEKALADKAFYDESGGGVTVSGGEPLMQAAAVAEFLGLARKAGLHTAMETSGFAGAAALERVLPVCDLVYLDIKLADSRLHRKTVGQPNDNIVANLRLMAARGVNLVVRTPLVPGCNMDDEAVRGLIDLLAPLNVRVEPLAFHQLGKNKYAAVGREYGLSGEKPIGDADLAGIIARFEAAGLKVVR